MLLNNSLAHRKPISLKDSVVSVRYLYRQYRKAYVIKYIDEDLICLNMTAHYRMPQEGQADQSSSLRDSIFKVQIAVQGTTILQVILKSYILLNTCSEPYLPVKNTSLKF